MLQRNSFPLDLEWSFFLLDFDIRSAFRNFPSTVISTHNGIVYE